MEPFRATLEQMKNLQTTPDAITLVRKRPEMFFENGIATPEIIANQISECAIELGAKKTNIKIKKDWFVIAGDIDWLTIPVEFSRPIEEYFSGIWALPEIGQNCHRPELHAGAFSKTIATFNRSVKTSISGSNINFHEIESIVSNIKWWERVVAYKSF